MYVKITEGTQENLIHELKNHKIDLALLYDIDLPNEIDTVSLSESSAYVALPKDHILSLIHI